MGKVGAAVGGGVMMLMAMLLSSSVLSTMSWDTRAVVKGGDIAFAASASLCFFLHFPAWTLPAH
jgi:Flp pilus assembly protein protease CpaA